MESGEKRQMSKESISQHQIQNCRELASFRKESRILSRSLRRGAAEGDARTKASRQGRGGGASAADPHDEK